MTYLDQLESILDSPTVAVIVGAAAAAILAYFFTVLVYRPQKVFEAKQRLYPTIVAAIQDFRRDIPMLKHALSTFPAPVDVAEIRELRDRGDKKALFDALRPQILYNYSVLEAVSRFDRSGELRARAAELAGDLANDHTWELLHILNAAVIADLDEASRALTSAAAELGMLGQSEIIEKFIGTLHSEGVRLLGTTVSSGGTENLDWSTFDSVLGALQTAIAKDMRRSGGFSLDVSGPTWADLGIPKQLQSLLEARWQDPTSVDGKSPPRL